MSAEDESLPGDPADEPIDSLRRGALEALGEWADPVAYQSLVSAEIEVEPDIAAWEASGGRMHGHRVTLSLDPDRYAVVRGAPAIIDALCAAVAVAVSRTPGEALVDFVIRGASREVTRRSPYRDAR